MASNIQEINVLRILLLVLAALPLITSTNIDCNGKAFHCVNSTHFMICVDIGHGLSSTVDDFMIPCPMSTECRITNRFECEYPPMPSTTTLASTTVEMMDSTTIVDQMDTDSFSEVNNVEHATTVSPVRDTNYLENKVTTEKIDTSIVIGSTTNILEDVMDHTLSPQVNEIYAENDLKLSTTASSNEVDILTTVDSIIAITATSDTTFTEPITQIVEITQVISDSLTHSSQYDTTSISAVSAESLKDFTRKDNDNVFVDVFTESSSNGNIEVTTNVFVPIELDLAPNTESVTTADTLVNEVYRNTEPIKTDSITTIADDILYTIKADTMDNSVNDTATTQSLVLFSKSEFSTDNTEATTDTRTKIFDIQDISNMSPQNAVPTDSNIKDTSTILMSDFNSVSTAEPVTTQDSTILISSFALPAMTDIEKAAFSRNNVFYGTTEYIQTEEFITEEYTQVNALVTENDVSNTPSGATISELPMTRVVEDYTELRYYDGKDLTTEHTETSYTTKSFYNFVDDKSPQNITTDIQMTIFDVQDTTNTSTKNVTPIDSINTDSSKLTLNDLNTLLTTESVTTQGTTTMSTKYATMTETDNIPFLSKNYFYSTEATHPNEITTKDDTQVNYLPTDSHIFHVTNAPSGTAISELPVIIVGKDFTEPENYDDITTEYAETTFSTESFSEGVTQNVEEIPTKVTEDTKIPSTIDQQYLSAIADHDLKSTEAPASSTSYLFEFYNQDLQTAKHIVPKLTIDLELSSESSNNILSEDSQTQNANVYSNNINNDAFLTPDMELLLPTIANDIESATEFLNQVEINPSIYNSTISKTFENFTLTDPAQIVQDKAGGDGAEISEKLTEALSVNERNTNIESISGVTTASKREDFILNATKLVSSSSTDENVPTIIYDVLNTDEDNEIGKIFTSKIDHTPEVVITSTTPATISKVNYATSTLVTPQVINQELLTEPVKDKLILKIPKNMSPLSATNNIIQIEKVTDSYKPTSLSSVINEETNINIDERITTTNSLIETDIISTDEDNMHINVLGFTTDEHTTAQATIQSIFDYKKYYDTVSTENYESITTQSDIYTAVYESLNYETVKTTQLNVKNNVGTSSTKYVYDSKSEHDLPNEVGKVMISSTMTSNQDIQIEQVRNIVIPITTTESVIDYDIHFGNSENNNYEETSTVKSILPQSLNNMNINIPPTSFITTTDKSNSNVDIVKVETREYKNTYYLDHKVKARMTESEDKNIDELSSEKNYSNTNVNNDVSIRQYETETYTTNSTYDTSTVPELTTLVSKMNNVDTRATTVNLNLPPVYNSTLHPDIKMMQNDASQILRLQSIAKVQNEDTSNKNVLTNIDINSQKNITQTSTKEKLDDYLINVNKVVTENNYDNVDSNIAYNQISNTMSTLPIPKVVLRVASDKPVHEIVTEAMPEPYSESLIHHSVSSIQNMTHRINASNDTLQNITTRIDEVKKLSSYTISTQTITKSVSENQSSHDRKEVQSSEATTSKLFDKDQNEKVNFDCLYRFRGRYADNENCRRFYICIGKPYPIIGMCPVNTVFSEFRKQCTNNLAHCVRNYVFYCTSEGRFSDIFKNNMYYICVRNNDNKFIRYKLQCENGYYLNKASVQCTPNPIVKSQSMLLESDNSQRSSDTSVSLTNSSESRKIKKGDDFQCEKEGKIPDPNNCKKYYVCSKNKSSFKKKLKSCDSDEVFDKHKEKCVDADSYEC